MPVTKQSFGSKRQESVSQSLRVIEFFGLRNEPSQCQFAQPYNAAFGQNRTVSASCGTRNSTFTGLRDDCIAESCISIESHEFGFFDTKSIQIRRTSFDGESSTCDLKTHDLVIVNGRTVYQRICVFARARSDRGSFGDSGDVSCRMDALQFFQIK